MLGAQQHVELVLVHKGSVARSQQCKTDLREVFPCLQYSMEKCQEAAGFAPTIDVGLGFQE